MGLMSATFVGCESSDDDATDIVGTWMCSDTETDTHNGVEYTWKEVVNLIFSSNGEFIWEYYEYEYQNGDLSIVYKRK